MTDSVFGVSVQIQHKPGSTAAEDGQRLEISDLGSRGMALSSVYRCSGNKGTDQLRRYGICVFDFAYEKSRFPHDASQMNHRYHSKGPEH